MANELFNVAGKVVVMTGGAGVLGKGISKYLAAQGAKMVVLDRSEEAGKALVDEIVAQGHEATFLYTDVMNKEVLEQNKKDILEKYGRIDVLLNAAGGSYYGYVSANDRVMVLGTRGGYTQIKYPVSGGFKYAFATNSDVNNYLKGGAGNNNVNNNVNSNNNTTQTNTGTYSISGNLLTVNGVAMTDYRIGGKYTNSYYAKVNGKKVYMAGSQCCGYARYIAYKLYGCHDKSATGKFKDVSGRVAPGKLTAQKMKAAVTAAGVGAHIRTSNRIGQSKHSMSIIAVMDSGFTVTDANSDGKNTIKVTTYTWSSYVSSKYGKRGLYYIKKYVG